MFWNFELILTMFISSKSCKPNMNLIWFSFATPVLMICIAFIKPSHICPYETNNFEMHFQKLLKYLSCLEFTCRAKTNFQRTLHLNVEKNLNDFPWTILYSHFSFLAHTIFFKFLFNHDNFYKCCGTEILSVLFDGMYKGCFRCIRGYFWAIKSASLGISWGWVEWKLRLSCEGF